MFRHRFTLPIVLASVASLLLAGCASGSGAGSGDQEVGDPAASAPGSAETVEGTWRGGDTDAAWLTLEDGTVTGSDGCNPVNGSYSGDDGTVRFDLGFTTLKACSDVKLSFARLTRATVEDGALALYDEKDSLITALGRR